MEYLSFSIFDIFIDIIVCVRLIRTNVYEVNINQVEEACDKNERKIKNFLIRQRLHFKMSSLFLILSPNSSFLPFKRVLHYTPLLLLMLIWTDKNHSITFGANKVLI